MAQHQESKHRLLKRKPAKTNKKRLALSNIGFRYVELLRLREILKAEAGAR